jgi:hypothetical protein
MKGAKSKIGQNRQGLFLDGINFYRNHSYATSRSDEVNAIFPFIMAGRCCPFSNFGLSTNNFE